MKFEHTDVWGFEHALRGMRNPKNSWNRSDSKTYIDEDGNARYEIGPNDLKLATALVKGGSPHRKFLRQIFVSVDITAPLFWWKEFDTYMVGVVKDSTSTMHKLSSTEIELSCFETDDYVPELVVDDEEILNGQAPWKIGEFNEYLLAHLEQIRKLYLKTGDKRYWKELIRWLPDGWLQTRTVTMSYENILNMLIWRNSHKLTEWREGFCSWAKTLPYIEYFAEQLGLQ